MEDYLRELTDCELCEWRCGVDRLGGERGVCMLGEPKVASCTLHPAPPQSYTVFIGGCNLRCLNCQNWNISHFPEQQVRIRGHLDPEKLAREALSKIRSLKGKSIGADRIFFSGGSPTPSLPYVERVVKEAERIDKKVGVNYDTNGFLTEGSLERVLNFTTSITFDIKAFSGEVHRALTGAPVEPVLRNAEKVIEEAKDKLWEFRYLLIPGINEEDVKPLSEFLCEIDKTVPLNFLAFRPNFIFKDIRGVEKKELDKAVNTAREAGLKNVEWSGRPGLPGKDPKDIFTDKGSSETAKHLAEMEGCSSEYRDCGACLNNKDCSIKRYRLEDNE